ncbi:RNA polymerase sigma factor SigJ [Thalassobaculum sp.]|uniref:RNA polymerase sigma factor SigJ n=1 Tax=Thalassobaculum sp. TaxID=2022740 RepID=UPI0032EFF7A8
MASADDELFEDNRRRLTGLAYRILGSLAEAEDAVQDSFVKWTEADRDAIDNPAAWLTTACTRRCLDLLRAARRTRVDYVGTWLPEPVQTVVDDTPESSLELSASLSTAFLLLLERLSPRERAAYLLHEIFEQPYPEVAATLGVQEAACRKLVSRARAAVGRPAARYTAPLDRQDTLLAAFRGALTSGRTERLAALLSDEIALSADGGGRATAIAQTLRGKAAVLDFMGSLHGYWANYEWRPADINGGRGVLLVAADGTLAAAVTFGFDANGRVDGIYVMRNPDKLARLQAGGTTLS